MQPATYEEAAEMLRAAAEAGRTIRISGVEAEDPDALSTARLDRIVEHNAGDLTAILQSGVTLSRAQEAFAAAGQMLALDPPDPSATVGGVVATADSGPLRHRYGGVRDLVIGATVALTDGMIAHSGGKVIKNVAGYDLAKLLAGSRGTLGLILEVAVRLHPLPRARATAAFETDDPVEIGRAAVSLSHAPLELESLDVRWRRGRGAVLARFSGVSALDRAREAGGELVEEDDALWAAQREGQAGGLRLSILQTDWPRLCRAADAAGGSLVGRAGLGLAWVTGADEAILRAEFPEREQSAAELELARRVRARFDVHGALVA